VLPAQGLRITRALSVPSFAARPFQLSRACVALLFGTKARAASPRIFTVRLINGLLPGLLRVYYHVRQIRPCLVTHVKV
jgi:hypothetical protein